MYLKEQIYILEIYRQQSLTKAAEVLCISQPALSNYLSNVEHALGTPLFLREKRGLVPTEAGKIYIKTATKMVRLQENFYLQLNPLLKGTPCVLRVGIQRIRTTHMVPGILEYFHRNYPEITVKFCKSGLSLLTEGLENEELDLILGYHIPSLYPESRYLVQPIARDRLCLAVSEKEYSEYEAVTKGRFGAGSPAGDSRNRCAGAGVQARTRQDPAFPGCLSGQTFILQPRDQSERMITDEYFSRNNIQPGKILEEDTIRTALWMAASGQGLTFTLESYQKYFQVPGVRLLPLDARLKTLTYALITRKQEKTPRYLRDLAEFVKGIF